MKKNNFLWISLILFFGGLLLTIISGFITLNSADYVVYYSAYIAFGVSFIGLLGVIIEFVINLIERFKSLKNRDEK